MFPIYYFTQLNFVKFHIFSLIYQHFFEGIGDTLGLKSAVCGLKLYNFRTDMGQRKTSARCQKISHDKGSSYFTYIFFKNMSPYFGSYFA